METPTHWKKLVNPDYFGSHDLINPDATYRTIIVTIVRVVQKEITGDGGKKNLKNVLLTKETKPIILNNVNQKMIQRVVGSPFIEKWAGHQIEIYVDKVKAFGEYTDALRVKNQKPNVTPRDYTAQIEAINACADINALVAVWNGLDGDAKTACLAHKDSRKKQLENESN
jgi:hypothetical protein